VHVKMCGVLSGVKLHKFTNVNNFKLQAKGELTIYMYTTWLDKECLSRLTSETKWLAIPDIQNSTCNRELTFTAAHRRR